MLRKEDFKFVISSIFRSNKYVKTTYSVKIYENFMVRILLIIEEVYYPNMYLIEVKNRT